METQGSGFGLPPLPKQEEHSPIGASAPADVLDGGLVPQQPKEEIPTIETPVIIKRPALIITINGKVFTYDPGNFTSDDDMFRQMLSDFVDIAQKAINDQKQEMATTEVPEE